MVAVSPRTATWKEVLTTKELFDPFPKEHAIIPLSQEGEFLESLLADLVQQYKLGTQQDVNKPGNIPSQID